MFLYSELNPLEISVYSKKDINVQLPPVQINGSVASDNTVYFHNLTDATIYTSVESQVDTAFNGWNVLQDSYNENDFITAALNDISTMLSVDKDNLTATMTTKLFGVLNFDGQLRLSKLINHQLFVYRHPLHFVEIPTLHGMSWILGHKCCSFVIPQIADDAEFKKLVPGLIFEFDGCKLIAIIAQPLPEKLNNIRKSYIAKLQELLTEDINFSTFKSFLQGIMIEQVAKPCIFEMKCEDIPHNAEEFLDASIAYSEDKSIWSTYDITDSIRHAEEAITTKTVKFNYIDYYNPCSYNEENNIDYLPTWYCTNFAKAFDIKLDTYLKLLEQKNQVLVFPWEIFNALRMQTIQLFNNKGTLTINFI